jgi:hypothetical protein
MPSPQHRKISTERGEQTLASFPTITGVTGMVREEFIAEANGLLGRQPCVAFGGRQPATAA